MVSTDTATDTERAKECLLMEDAFKELQDARHLSCISASCSLHINID